MFLEIFVLAIVLIFGLTVFRGAPYVPTHRRQIEVALEQVPEGGTILDLGSGDGAVLRVAAQKGLRAYGLEINPLLFAISWFRTRRFGKKVHVRWRDFWFTPIPQEVDAIFVFAGGPFMSKLAQKLQKEVQQRSKPLVVISYAFSIPGKKPRKVVEGLRIYWYD